jgi:NAD(P)-dependent dehydrogenase (short-subunit alcohol dehydrogenase family)
MNSSKIALVTGGSRGLGKDMVIALAKKGIDVILTYYTKKEEAYAVAEEVEKIGQKAAVLYFNAEDFNSLDGFVADLTTTLMSKWQQSKIDFIIHNAGIGASIAINNASENDFDKFMNIHFKSVYFLTQKTVEMMNDKGAYVFISSGSTRFCVNGYSIYSSMKAAIEMFSKFVAKEYGNRGIRSNVVAPGPIETDFNNAAIRNNPAMKSYLSGATSLGRVGAADDIGSVVAFLCTEEAKWVNAQRIEVSGGINI